MVIESNIFIRIQFLCGKKKKTRWKLKIIIWYRHSVPLWPVKLDVFGMYVGCCLMPAAMQQQSNEKRNNNNNVLSRILRCYSCMQHHIESTTLIRFKSCASFSSRLSTFFRVETFKNRVHCSAAVRFR